MLIQVFNNRSYTLVGRDAFGYAKDIRRRLTVLNCKGVEYSPCIDDSANCAETDTRTEDDLGITGTIHKHQVRVAVPKQLASTEYIFFSIASKREYKQEQKER